MAEDGSESPNQTDWSDADLVFLSPEPAVSVPPPGRRPRLPKQTYLMAERLLERIEMHKYGPGLLGLERDAPFKLSRPSLCFNWTVFAEKKSTPAIELNSDLCPSDGLGLETLSILTEQDEALCLLPDEPFHDKPLHDAPLNNGPMHDEPLPDSPPLNKPLPDSPPHDEPLLNGPLQNRPLHDVPLHTGSLQDEPLHNGPAYDEPLHNRPLYDEHRHNSPSPSIPRMRTFTELMEDNKENMDPSTVLPGSSKRDCAEKRLGRQCIEPCKCPGHKLKKIVKNLRQENRLLRNEVEQLRNTVSQKV